MTTPSNPPRRFPRIHPGDTAAALAILLRSSPMFKVRVPKDKMSVVFSYEFSVPDDLPPEYSVLYAPFFAGGRQYWKESISVAIEGAEERQKRALGRVYSFHRSVLTESFRNWLFDSWGLGIENKAARKDELEIFKKNSLLTRGTKPDAWIALMAAIRYRQLNKVIKEMLDSLKADPQPPITKQRQINNEIERSKLSRKVLGRALATILYADGKGITFMELLTPRINSQRIARAMVCCGLKDQGCDLRLISGTKYINYGMRLLDVLDDYRSVSTDCKGCELLKKTIQRKSLTRGQLSSEARFIAPIVLAPV